MKNISLKKAFHISRIIFILFVLLMISGAITKIKIVVLLGVALASISWITPGILILLKVPWLAQSWLRGINTFWIPGEPWEQLTSSKRVLIYFYSLVFSVFIIIALINYVIQWLQR